MRPQAPEITLVNLLRQCCRSSRCESVWKGRQIRFQARARTLRTSARLAQRRDREGEYLRTSIRASKLDDYSNHSGIVHVSHPSSNVENSPLEGEVERYSPTNIAILGGGITGLASAYNLSRLYPSTHVILYEASERFGGWLRSKHIDVGTGKIVFEQGPRTLRPHSDAGLITLKLVKQLGLENEMVLTPKSSVAARNRYIYYPDHLVKMPGPGQTLYQIMWRFLTEPAFKGLLSALTTEFTTPARPRSLEDESIGSFMQRRLGNPYLADNIVSGVLHGIYAGDIYKLSVKSLFPLLWFLDGKYGSIFRAQLESFMRDSTFKAVLDDNSLILPLEEYSRSLPRSKELPSTSVYSFKKGIETLSDALVSALEANPKVSLKRDCAVTKVSYDSKDNKIKISTSHNQPPASFARAVSTISGRTLSYLTDHGHELPSLQSAYAVTVMVVNLYYTNPSILSVNGFGYLIPRSVPWNQNPERALGVVFDSDTSTGLDTATGTKVTVMLGGHWWDGWSSYPDEEEGAAMAKTVLKRHLKIEEEPAVVNVSLQRDCIPQYAVGHNQKMKQAHNELMATFKGKLAVAGNSYTGVGLNDCVVAATNIKYRFERLGPDPLTGLELFTKDQVFEVVKKIKTLQSNTA